MAGKDEKSANPVQEADKLIRNGELEKAHEMLMELVAKVPSGWKTIQEMPERIDGAFWDLAEFMSYVTFHKKKQDKRNLFWTSPSYSKAYYLLAYIAVERKDWKSALEMLDRGIALEPDHPMLLCEKAHILKSIGEPKNALELYRKAMTVRPWASSAQTARAMRGVAFILIDLNRLDEAEALLLKSLELEPGNKVALNELGYIKHLREGGKQVN